MTLPSSELNIHLWPGTSNVSHLPSCVSFRFSSQLPVNVSLLSHVRAPLPVALFAHSSGLDPLHCLTSACTSSGGLEVPSLTSCPCSSHSGHAAAHLARSGPLPAAPASDLDSGVRPSAELGMDLIVSDAKKLNFLGICRKIGLLVYKRPF